MKSQKIVHDFELIGIIYKRDVHFSSDVVHYKIELVEENLKVI